MLEEMDKEKWVTRLMKDVIALAESLASKYAAKFVEEEIDSVEVLEKMVDERTKDDAVKLLRTTFVMKIGSATKLANYFCGR